jgi:hypothetical protein
MISLIDSEGYEASMGSLQHTSLIAGILMLIYAKIVITK